MLRLGINVRSPMFTCPECESVINQGSEMCPSCGADLRAGGPEDVQTRQRSWKKTGAALGVLLAAIGAVVWFALPSRRAGSGITAEQETKSVLGSVQQQLTGYAAAEGHFPNSLEDLGVSMRTLVQEAQSGGYELQYVPGLAGSDGRIHSYALLARPRNYGSRNFYTDESGVIRATKEGRAATAHDPPA
jgi:type II secretory pathway pseudopilin PulG